MSVNYCFTSDEPTAVDVRAYTTNVDFLGTNVRVFAVTEGYIHYAYVDLPGYCYPPTYVGMVSCKDGVTFTREDAERLFEDEDFEDAIKKLFNMALENAVFGRDVL